jgi:hypothetical protein
VRAFLASALLLSACATTDSNRYEGSTDSRPGLSAANLSDGECGLFVWRKDEAKTFLIFSSAKDARIYIDEEFTFPPNADPLAPEQSFTANDRDWTLRLSDPKPIQDGTRYDAGTLKTTTDGGWDLIVSGIGLTNCAQDAVSS